MFSMPPVVQAASQLGPGQGRAARTRAAVHTRQDPQSGARSGRVSCQSHSAHLPPASPDTPFQRPACGWCERSQSSCPQTASCSGEGHRWDGGRAEVGSGKGGSGIREGRSNTLITQNLGVLLVVCAACVGSTHTHPSQRGCALQTEQSCWNNRSKQQVGSPRPLTGRERASSPAGSCAPVQSGSCPPPAQRQRRPNAHTG